ncbi:hypothetical protein EGW08_006036 [Elysia chlorotica]|uniref:G-protein coupled receptors family 1 profile domain-containing protein n=1 Tax=Elysia chlorotica TaxID=188477 RepID=A0A3S1BL09_ELYCH|nr:hypothetical protein EGW08_006036 [Elysia chlorotica]
MVSRRILRLQRAGSNPAPSADGSSLVRGFQADTSRIGHHGPAMPLDAGGPGSSLHSSGSHQLRGHMKRGWRNLQQSSAGSLSNGSDKPSAPVGSFPRSSLASEARELPTGPLQRDWGGRVGGHTGDHGKPSGDIFNNNGRSYTKSSETLGSDISGAKGDRFQYRNHVASDAIKHRQGGISSSNQFTSDYNAGRSIHLNDAVNSGHHDQPQYRLDHSLNSDASRSIRHRRLVQSPGPLTDRHSRPDSSGVYSSYEPYNTFPKPQSPVPSGTRAETFSAGSDNHHFLHNRQNMTSSVYDALQSNAYPGTGNTVHSPQPLPPSQPPLFPHYSNLTAPTSGHAYNPHDNPSPVASPISVSAVPSTASQDVYKNNVLSSSPYTSLLSSSISSSSSSSSSSSLLSSVHPAISPEKVSSSSSLSHYPSSPNPSPSQTFLRHLGLDSANLTSSGSSGATWPHSPSSFSERLRQSGLESLNLGLEPAPQTTMDALSIYNHTDDFWSIFGEVMDVNDSSTDIPGVTQAGNGSATSGLQGGDLEYKYWTMLLVIFPLLTVFGNILVVLSVVKEKSLKTVTNYFICSLAVADIMVAVVVMPLAVYMEVGARYIWFSIIIY